MKQLYILMFCLLQLTIVACDEEKEEGAPQCISFPYAVHPPYREPLWHPSGKLISFNYTPLTKVDYYDRGKCGTDVSHSFNWEATAYWTVNADGSNMQQVLPFEVSTAAWSPDGTRLAIIEGGLLKIIPFDGEQFDLTAIVSISTGGSSHFPSWSPDGKWIVYDSNYDSPGGGYYVWKINLADGTRTRLKPADQTTSMRFPNWSIDDRILYMSYVNDAPGQADLFSMNSQGEDVQRLTQNIASESYAKFSPDGEKIAYLSDDITGRGEHLWIMNSDGSDPKQITDKSIYAFSWAPDGRIVYVNYAYDLQLDESKGVLWVMNADGSNKQQLTSNSGYEVTYN